MADGVDVHLTRYRCGGRRGDQLLPLYLRGMLRCPVMDPEERMHEIAFLAALQYKASGEDQRRNTNHAYVTVQAVCSLTRPILTSVVGRDGTALFFLAGR